MRLWFSRHGEVTLREQLVTQVILGVLSGDLAAGQRLPSTRELARRFRLHPNTVSAGYRQLVKESWAEYRRGSGVYIRKHKIAAQNSGSLAVDELIGNMFRGAREKAIPLSTLRARLQRWLELQPPDHFLVIEPDEEFRRILATEIERAVKFPVTGIGLDPGPNANELRSGIALAFSSSEPRVREALPTGTDLVVLSPRSVPRSLEGWLPAPATALVAVASRWSGFLKLAKTMLVAAGFHPDTVMLRDARDAAWRAGLKQAAAVIADSVTAPLVPKGCRVIPFTLISDESLAELKRHQEFVVAPLD